MTVPAEIDVILSSLGLIVEHGVIRATSDSNNRAVKKSPVNQILNKFSPIDGTLIGNIECHSRFDYESLANQAENSFKRWRLVPAPVRGQMVRSIADAFRGAKGALAHLITLETGKIVSEAEGEVQEAIDIADFAVGLSRQIGGLTLPSERPLHRMMEQWHPLGLVGVITAFNFPVAVWAWNAMLAAICGDITIWKPSEHAPISALAANSLAQRAASQHGYEGIFTLVCSSDSEAGKWLAADRRISLLSATGSTAMGKSVATTVAERLSRSLLELGGNNEVIVMSDANLDLALQAVLFGAVGTSGQRCTTTRRLLIAKDIREQFLARLIECYRSVTAGDPRHAGTLLGPLIHQGAVNSYLSAIAVAKEQGGIVLYGGNLIPGLPSALYVEPTIIDVPSTYPVLPIVDQETFGRTG